MNNPTEQLVIWILSRHRQPDTLRQFQQKSCSLLKTLRNISDVFDSLAVVQEGNVIPLPKNPTALNEIIGSMAAPAENRDDYLNPGIGYNTGPQTLSRVGFSITYRTYDQGAQSVRAVNDGGVELIAQGVSAGLEPNAQVILKFRCSERVVLAVRNEAKAYLAAISDEWGADVGGAYISTFQASIKGTHRSSYAGQWLYYLPFPHLGRCLPADIHHEPFANGILIQTTPHMPNADNPADVAAGKRVRDVLDEFGLINDATYAIAGWPPDPEESMYEQFISGAPAGRKYTVHCVNFDGYDADRKVLLYAKLFRRLRRHPKEHGLRGWDGPVLNEVRRQVRAAAKAGGVPIEWHIGLEEPAAQVRQLLAEHTNITEQQLRVIHTPLDEALKNSPT